jgi:hypothetical protein
LERQELRRKAHDQGRINLFLDANGTADLTFT